MNTVSQVISILVLWLITGLAFSSVFIRERKKGRSIVATFKTVEGIVFLISVAAPLVYLVYRF